MRFIHPHKKGAKQLVLIRKWWNDQEKELLKCLGGIMDMKFSSKGITCKIDPTTTNGFYGPKSIILGTKGEITKDEALLVIAHELIHIHYWKKITELKLTKNVMGSETQKEWELAEVVAYLVTTEKWLKKIWPTAAAPLYPEIKRLYLEVHPYWDGRPFNKFIKRVYKHINKA